MRIGNYIALTLIIIGALNWGLIGFFGFDLVTTLFHGSAFWLARVIFALVGFAALWARKQNFLMRHIDHNINFENQKFSKATEKQQIGNTGGFLPSVHMVYHSMRRKRNALYQNGRLWE